ncbi:ABC transporter substrate-binding protein [Nocardioides baekrokdamisoli]|uniref:ABC transporter substrate-binding protein n=1 Tax=Nocardioides baekrokdamisoli TaxID=1804624 RepID=A0A3G9IGD0_9ACTN|nr:ABC transporter substrate-binding protein [Nocardioides baekrokdamisoli]BBH18110.1 ABC transporter substrate-binding protein [Nocardioides baekrokdamisoli]
MNRWTSARTAAAVAVLAAGLSACGTSTGSAGTTGGSFPVSVGSSTAAITLTAKPIRIVSLSATATEDLFAIGAGSQVVAVDKDSDYPASAPHTQLDAYQLNAEAVAAYKPDLVIEAGLTPAQVGQLTRLHIPVLIEPAAANLDEAYAQINELGKATGHVSEAADLVTSMKSKVASIIAQTPKTSGTFYYELDPTYYSVTSSTFVGQLFKMLDLTSIADRTSNAAGGYPQLSGEFVLKSNPGYVFLADSICCGQNAAKVGTRPGWSALSAVSGGRVIALNDDIASRWGPRVVDLLQTIADAIKTHPVK